jgi:signal transduction histidine kinase
MAPEEKPLIPEREQTDESLRVERENVDDALGDELAAVDETADDVISKARARADAVLAGARADMDRQTRHPNAKGPASIERERLLEDRILEDERASADETLRVERAEHVALISTQRDDTDKDLLSERAQSDDSLATRDAFLGVVGHDLRNMLGAMIGFAGLIEQGLSPANLEEQKHAQRIQRAGARMNRLIGDLVDVASIEAGMLAVTRELGDPAQVVMEAVDTFQAKASASGVSLTAEIVGPTVLVAFDPARILQVIINLLSNAIKFTPTNGKVVVHLERVGDDLSVAVVDTGIGIPDDKLEAVFERFRQLSPNDRRGVGLGLYISKCIVQGHGGRISAKSKLGVGSTFSFTLPIEPAASRTSRPPSA